MKKRMICIVLVCAMFFWKQAVRSEAEEEQKQLYARAAVLMDKDSGRLLFAKNAEEQLPMASTTKIMTCILALERCEEQEVVTVGKEAEGQPKVRLGIRKGQKFYLGDLLYSMMLESNNDVAVAVAEHVGGTLPAFLEMMNEKARDLGLRKTHFVTPNGLDGTDAEGKHQTTAKELALLMRYCLKDSPKREAFLRITRKGSHFFSDVEGTSSYTCGNHNAFLGMMEGALTGKTGFTNDAGYCYVGALENKGRTFIVALLACGWPGHRTYKWEDTKSLMVYGIENFQKKKLLTEACEEQKSVLVTDGIPKEQDLFSEAFVRVKVDEGEEPLYILMKEGERAKIRYETKRNVKAPVKKGEALGMAHCYLGEERIVSYPLRAEERVEKADFRWYFQMLWGLYCI